MAESQNDPSTNPVAEKGFKGRERVFVACKLPNGALIDMRDSAGKVVRVKLEGFAVPVAPTAARPFAKHLIEGGYGLTSVDKEMFDAWMATHQDFSLVKNGLIFSTKTSTDTQKEAKSRRNEKSGLEPLAIPKKTDKPQTIGLRNDED